MNTIPAFITAMLTILACMASTLSIKAQEPNPPGTYTLFSGLIVADDNNEKRPVIIRLNTSTGKTEILELTKLQHHSGNPIDVIGWTDLKTWTESMADVPKQAEIYNWLHSNRTP